MSYSVVWFKRDLRLADHAPLCAAAARGPVLCLYVVEPGLWQQPDASARQYHFLRESLHDLAAQLRERGLRLYVAVGDMAQVLTQLYAQAPFDALFAHEETGNDWTYRRDIAVARWCAANRVHWREWPQFGVVRGGLNRDHWQPQWEALMAAPLLPVPPLQQVALSWPPVHLPGAAALGLGDGDAPGRQPGGRTAALAVLEDFLLDRAAQYRGGISSPLSAPSACSRLSPYLALGCLSMREVVQASRAMLAQLHGDASASRRVAGIRAFISRLYWHCHFIQKLESEPALEWRNLHRGYDGLRENDWDEARFAAWRDGRTGWPLVDACIAMLRHTGWLNFRMRAMLVSVAAYPLWLHWRPVGLWLAQQFVDYEPGIHWSQLQMQSGTTGINVPRIYNPLKQAREHDPHGRFVRQWLPPLRRVPDVWLFEPWRMPPDIQARCGVEVGRDIPQPLVDVEAATREAKARLFALRGRPEVRAGKAAIVTRHGSRKRGEARGRRQPPATPGQLSLDW